ncbi:MAG: MMPL family transporter [Pirellulales bacterium]|nr:MMPL family transporter [Pirellulales bacterium]
MKTTKPAFFARNSFIILMIVAFLLPFFFMGTRRAIRSNKNDVKSWLPSAYEETATFHWYRSHFESDMFILASWEGCTLDNAALPLLARKLLPPEEHSLQVGEPRFFKSAVTGREILQSLIDQGVEAAEAVERLKGFVIGRDGKQTCLVLTVRPEAEAEWDAEAAAGKRGHQKFLHALVERIYHVAETECAITRDELHLGGPPVDNVSIDQEGERTLMRLAGVSAVVGLIMSWWCLRSWGLTAMVFTTALFSAGLSIAIVWFSGVQMNAILMTMPSLVYVAATSGAIHLANYYRDAIREHGMENAPGRAVANAWLPLALATGTTAVGLASLGISELVPIKMFGIYSAIGVLGSLLVLCFYLPAVLQFWPLKALGAESGPRRFDPGLSPRWRGVGEFIIRRNGLVTVGCLALMALGAYGVSQVETSVKLMRMFSPDARIIHDYAWLEEKLGPLVPMEVVLRIDPRKCSLDMLDQMELVAEVRDRLGAMEEVGSALAAPTFTRDLPQRPSFIERRVWIVQLQRHRAKLTDFFQQDGEENLWRISARVGALTNVDYGRFVDNLKQVVEPVLDERRNEGIEGLSATYTGLVPLIYKAQHSLLDGLILGFVGDLILIGIAMVLLMRNLSAGLLLMVPSIFPMAIIFGGMGLLGIVVDTGTVMTPAVALGVTVDDAIHFMLWCRHGQERGMDRRRAIMFAYEDCARAIYQSWGVIGLGLFAFALSSFVPTQRFGCLMLTMLTVSAIGNLVLLPALLAGPMGHFFWRTHKKASQDHAIPAPHIAETSVESAATRGRDRRERGEGAVVG